MQAGKGGSLGVISGRPEADLNMIPWRKSNRVYYIPGKGWHYCLHGDMRGPFKKADEAKEALEREKRELRALRNKGT